MLDDEKFPALTEYLAGVPDGLDSYPACWAKASLYRSVIADRPLTGPQLAGLPATLSSLFERPVPVSSWISEVHSHALMLAVYDVHFGDLESFAGWAYAQQRALFTSPLYSVAMRLVSPSMLFKSASIRFGMFHRGARLVVLERRDDGGTARLEYAPGLYDPISLAGLSAGLRAALDLTTTGNTSIEVTESGDDYAVLSAAWEG